MIKDRGMQWQQLADWWLSPLGRELLSLEQERLTESFQHAFGFHLLLLGVSLQLPLVTGSRVPSQTLINPYPSDADSCKVVRGLWEMLPVLENSVDVVIAPHTLEISADPLETLKEIYRVLIPEGRVLLFGLNPYSLWRLWSMFHGREGQIPWSCEWQSAGRVKWQLQSLGFTVNRVERFFIQPPLKRASLFRRLHPLNYFRKLGLGGISGVYFIEAQKKVHGMCTIRADAMAVKKVKSRQRVVVPVPQARCEEGE